MSISAIPMSVAVVARVLNVLPEKGAEMTTGNARGAWVESLPTRNLSRLNYCAAFQIRQNGRQGSVETSSQVLDDFFACLAGLAGLGSLGPASLVSGRSAG